MSTVKLLSRLATVVSYYFLKCDLRPLTLPFIDYELSRFIGLLFAILGNRGDPPCVSSMVVSFMF